MAVSRGRRRQFDTERVLDTITHAFWRSGYDGTSLADLTSLTGVNPPSLYAAFGDKRALFFEVVAFYQKTYGAFTVHALGDEPTALLAITRMLREAAVVYTDPGHPKGCLIISAANGWTPQSSEISDAMRDLRTAGRDAIEAKIKVDVDAGLLPTGTDAHGLAVFFAAVVQGMSGQARDGATREELERIAETALKVWPVPVAA
ncbi:TetR/AcrR family transcriptional regulator [Dactylosporangium sp. NPDC000555]|uniref:TetR/AcrR family transcriptional regulator n=1 Tax=Dactylosporangium sp. NPDC000555 TaxID=3154260 RepID=UPI003325932F